MNTPTYEQAMLLGLDGMARVEAKAEMVCPCFSAQASDFILKYLAGVEEATAEDITDACIKSGIKPHDQRAFGPVFKKLLTHKRIIPTGMCARRKGHCAPGGRIYKLARS